MGERKQPVDNFKQAFNWMMREVKKGQHIQRYKGLAGCNLQHYGRQVPS
jgi:DNA gyrase subunit B